MEGRFLSAIAGFAFAIAASDRNWVAVVFAAAFLVAFIFGGDKLRPSDWDVPEFDESD